MIDLISLQNKIHQQNKDMGWWDNPRPFSTMICLFHSELSEAMEGDRKNLMDDHLPQYPMFQVELADFVIRCLDYLGSVGFNSNNLACIANTEDDEKTLLAYLHGLVSKAHEAKIYGGKDSENQFIFAAAFSCFAYAKMKGFDLLKIINEKVEYNLNREDHKRENRAKEGGKQY